MVKKIGNKKVRKKVKNNCCYDIQKLKKAIKNKLYSHITNKNKNENERLLNPSFSQNIDKKEEKDYYLKYAKYMTEDFNSTIVSMVITYINKNKSLISEYLKEPNFINKFINLIKHLLMNEFELSCFTIILDEMGWCHPEIEHWTYFCVLGVYSKKIVCGEEESSLLIDIFTQKNNEFITYYTIICDDEMMNKFEKEKINIQFINDKFRQLTKPNNSYCRRNFIIYNGVVDKIVKWSQPYGDESNGNQLYNNEQQINLINNKNELTFNLRDDYNQLDFLFPLDNKKNIKNVNDNNNIINNNINNIINNNYHNNINNNNFNINNINNNNSNNLFFQYNNTNNLNLNNEQSKSYMNNININKYNISDLNMHNSFLPSLNLLYRHSSQLSLKLDNSPSNQNINNINNLI